LFYDYVTYCNSKPTNALNCINITIILKHTSCYMFRPLCSHHRGASNVQNSCLTLSELPKTSQCVIYSSRASFGLKTVAFKIRNYKIHRKLFHFDVQCVRTLSIRVFKAKYDGREIPCDYTEPVLSRYV
jgi:hypothetical protein